MGRVFSSSMTRTHLGVFTPASSADEPGTSTVGHAESTRRAVLALYKAIRPASVGEKPHASR